MKKNKYKILVLSDLKKSTSNTLKSSVSLAKIINGEITCFHVKKPIDILEKDNQLSAMRTINQESNITDKTIQDVIAPISKDYGVNINYRFVFGNLKHEIEKHMTEQQPDIIVLGKRKSKSMHVVGDKLAHFVLKKHKGVVMIAANENALEPNKEIALGILNGMEHSFNLEFAEDLLAHTQTPLKSFRIVKNATVLNKMDASSNNKTIEYIFEEGDNAINNLSGYLSKNNINLLCMDRGKGKANSISSDIKDAINTFNVSLLLTSKQKYSVQ
tara:strand:- start:39025 stop:39840 length:816 start_codon:yes stop_codon:yes gene_type:complete